MLNSELVRKLIQLALAEDLSFGDVTSELCVAPDCVCSANIVAREELVVCGLELIGEIFAELKAEVRVEVLVPDGEKVLAETVLAKLSGPTRQILSAERTLLNFLQRASGIATHVNRFVTSVAGLVTVLDTRKTVPGWRLLDKYAVRVGGAQNHRASLGDMILVKNNHIDAAPGATPQERMRNCLRQIAQKKPYFMPLEIEVRNLEELAVALEFNPSAVMFDNMQPSEIERGVAITRQAKTQIAVEVSGRMTIEKIKALKNIGVDCVSVGALTSGAPQVDISLRIKAK